MSAKERDQTPGRWLGLLCLLLLLGTAGLAQTRFTFGDQPLLPNLGFESGLAGWEVRPEGSTVTVMDGVATLTQPDHAAFVGLWRKLQDVQRFRHLRLSAEMKTDAVVPGELFWQKARIVLVGRDTEGNAMIQWDHVLTSGEGSRPWWARQAVFEVVPGTVTMQLGVELPGAAGSVSVRNLSLTAAEQVGWYEAAGLLLIAGWATAALWGSRRLLAARRRLPWRQGVLAILLALPLLQVVPELGATRFVPLLPFGFIDVVGRGNALAVDATWALPEHTEPTLAEPTDGDGEGLQNAVESVQFRVQQLGLFAHFVGFLILTVVCSKLAGVKPMTLLPYLSLAALAGEIAQWSVQGQFSAADLIELLADFAGVAAVSLVLLARGIVRAS